MRKYPFIEIIRPYNCLFVALTVLFGAFFRSENTFNYNIIFAMLSATTIAAAGYVINDFFDITIDVINRPNRVLPRKAITPSSAYMYGVTLFLVGMFFGVFTQNLYCMIIAVVNSLFLFWYAKNLKKSLFIGNFIVSYAAGSTFIYGGICSNNLKNSLFIASIAFFYTFIRELVKDAEDIEGDSANGSRTIAILMGRRRTVKFSASIIIPIIIIFLASFRTGFLSLNILTVLLLTVALPLLIFHILLLKKLDTKNLHKYSNLMKINMLYFLIVTWFI